MSAPAKPNKPWLNKFQGASAEQKTSPPRLPPRRDELVRSGSTIDAEAWRGAFIAAMRFESKPRALHAQLISGIESQAWKLLRDQDGVRFRSFDHFCQARPPCGLGNEPDVVRAHLARLLGQRSAAILLAPPSNQGERVTPASRPGGEKSNRHQQRLRAIAERAPEPVRKLCQLGVLSFKQAEALAPVDPPQKRVAEILHFAFEANAILQGIGAEPSDGALSRARQQVRELLPAPDRKDPVEVLLKSFGRLPGDQQQRFLDLAREQLAHASVVAAE